MPLTSARYVECVCFISSSFILFVSGTAIGRVPPETNCLQRRIRHFVLLFCCKCHHHHLDSTFHFFYHRTRTWKIAFCVKCYLYFGSVWFIYIFVAIASVCLIKVTCILLHCLNSGTSFFLLYSSTKQAYKITH